MIFADVPAAAVESWIQYGSFGLLCMFALWAMWKVIPAALAAHTETVKGIATDHKAVTERLVCAFEEESVQCRTERIETARLFAAEREKDRDARYDLAQKFAAAIHAKTT